VNYGPFVKNLVKVLILALLPPLLLLKLLGRDGIIPMIIYLQLLLFEVQAEIGLRQHRLFLMQFEPFFNVDIGTTDAKGGKTLYLHNTSKNSAYDITLRMLDKQCRPMPPEKWKDKVSLGPITTGLAPGQGDMLCDFNKDFYESVCENEMAFAVDYFNQFDEDGGIHIRFFKGTPHIKPAKQRMPGPLLNTFEDLSFLYKFIKLKRSLKSQKLSKLK